MLVCIQAMCVAEIALYYRQRMQREVCFLCIPQGSQVNEDSDSAVSIK